MVPRSGSLTSTASTRTSNPRRQSICNSASRRIGNVKVTLTGYRQDVRQTIFSQTIAIPDSVTGDLTQSSLMTNNGKVRTWGADLIVSAEKVLIDGLSLDANASWIDAEVTRKPLNPALVGNKFPRVPTWGSKSAVSSTGSGEH